MGQKKQDIESPRPRQRYESGMKVYLKYLPKELQQEFGYRRRIRPSVHRATTGVTSRSTIRQWHSEQMAALQRRDPEWLAMHKGLGQKITEGLERGYLDPRQEAAYAKYAEMAGQGEPTRDAAYQALGKQVTGDTLRGGTASPEMLRQMTQAILSRQPSLSYGEAQDMAAAVYTGQRSEALKSQRQQATGHFLQTCNAYSATGSEPCQLLRTGTTRGTGTCPSG